MNVLGISDVSGNYPHSCVALLQNGYLSFALSQERITRIKDDSAFPAEAIQLALDFAGLRLKDIDLFASAYPPVKYFASLSSHSRRDPWRSYLNTWLHRPVKFPHNFLRVLKKNRYSSQINYLLRSGISEEKFTFIDTHLARASAAYFSSEFKDCLVISYGVMAPHMNRQNVAGAIYRCNNNTIEHLQDIPAYADICFLSAVTAAIGFRPGKQEGKAMGLAAYGDKEVCLSAMKQLVSQFIADEWQTYKYWVDYSLLGQSNIFFGSKSGRALAKLVNKYSRENVAAAAQALLEENVINYIRYLVNKYDAKNLALAGEFAANVQLNTQIAGIDKIAGVFVHPHPGSGSAAIGAAIEASRHSPDKIQRIPLPDMGLGIEYSDAAIENDIRRVGSAVRTKFLSGDLAMHVAEQLAAGKIIGWFQGREEFGPRSLGHRCILGDPGKIVVCKMITELVKGRELTIPLATSCLEEKASEYFQDFEHAPHMTRVFMVRAEKAEMISGCIHKNGTARIQSVSKNCYQPFRKLIEYFYLYRNIPMVLNSSLNRHNEPIVHRPLEAIQLLIDSHMDELVIGSFSVTRP
jgi:carbamoyltransferase